MLTVLKVRLRMNLLSLITKNRSYRRFHQSKLLSENTLKELVNLARLSASARNQQSLKYYISAEPDLNASIFECLAWAAYLTKWAGPDEGERPTGYVVILNDQQIATNHFCDEGIAAQSILLGAIEKKLGGCIIASVNKPKLKNILNLPDHLEILLVLALGEPLEQVKLEEIQNNDFKYWRDENQVHHVPKRPLDEIIVEL